MFDVLFQPTRLRIRNQRQSKPSHDSAVGTAVETEASDEALRVEKGPDGAGAWDGDATAPAAMIGVDGLAVAGVAAAKGASAVARRLAKGAVGSSLDTVQFGVEGLDAFVKDDNQGVVGCYDVGFHGGFLVDQLFLQLRLHGADLGIGVCFELAKPFRDGLDELCRLFLVVDQFDHVDTELFEGNVDVLRTR
ncbi:hypothetical protein PG985_009751 [Apiospora marii]|uniref:uncharacterized protein n=1 Tax=Apiospora marii TaxID=335849 RepID=UPI00312FF85E